MLQCLAMVGSAMLQAGICAELSQSAVQVSYDTNGIRLGYWNYAVRISDALSYVHLDFLIYVARSVIDLNNLISTYHLAYFNNCKHRKFNLIMKFSNIYGIFGNTNGLFPDLLFFILFCLFHFIVQNFYPKMVEVDSSVW